MILRRDPVKALQIGFLALLMISIAQVAWWTTESVSYTRSVHERLTVLYEADARAVISVYADMPEALEELLPHLDISPTDGMASVNETVSAMLAKETSSRINRHVWEGGFFVLVLLCGLTVLTRTIRHDAELRVRQQNFLAAVSHEFKSPLASMRLSAETLLMRVSNDDSQRLGHRILDDGERLLRMVDNLLDTARLEEGRVQLAPEIIRLHPLAESCLEELAVRAEHNNIELQFDVPQNLAIYADRAMLETVLRNLLDNAVKACIAGKGRRIELHAGLAGDRVEFSVSDDGLGFPPEDAAMIFEKFYRLGDELRRSTPGTGLGLYIVRQLVKLCDASISAKSDGPDCGAKLTVSWPEAKNV